MKKIILGIGLIALLQSCNGEAIEQETKGDFRLELLFEKDGCKVYRFEDAGRNVYWSTCEGKTEYSYRTGGKNSTTQFRTTMTVKK